MYLHAPKFYFGMNFEIKKTTVHNLISSMADIETNENNFRYNFAGWFCEAYVIPHVFGWRLIEILEENYKAADFKQADFVKTFLEWYAGVCRGIIERVIQLDILFQEETKMELNLLHNPYDYKIDVTGHRVYTVNCDTQQKITLAV